MYILFTQVENMQLGTSWLLMILGIKGRTKFKLPVSCFLKDIDEAYAYIPLTDYAWTKRKISFSKRGNPLINRKVRDALEARAEQLSAQQVSGCCCHRIRKKEEEAEAKALLTSSEKGRERSFARTINRFPLYNKHIASSYNRKATIRNYTVSENSSIACDFRVWILIPPKLFR